MIFQTPQWRWRTDYEPLQYGFVANAVHVCPERGREHIAYVAVPTEFFQLVSTVFSEEVRLHAAIVGADFYLDQDVASNRWVFGLETLDGKHHIDLWPYIPSQLPPWASR